MQQLPKLWELFHDFGMTTLELNPIRMREDKKGRLTPVACDFKCGFDRDDPRWLRLDLPPHLFAADYSDFEQEINQLRTHQGQSDVYVINDKGTILAPTFGGGANSLVTEMLGDAAIISSDFGGNPPYEKMKEVARICFKHWLKQANVLFIIGGKSNNTDIFETLRAMADALREHFSEHGPTPLYVVVGRGGPNLVRGMAALRDTCDALGLPYRLFGFDSDMSEVIQYARRADTWMQVGRTRAGCGAHRRARRRNRIRHRPEEIGHAQARQSVDFKYYVGISSLAQIRHARRPRLRAQHPWRRIERRDAGEPRLSRAATSCSAPRPARADRCLRRPHRRHPGLQQRARRRWTPGIASTAAWSICRLRPRATAWPS